MKTQGMKASARCKGTKVAPMKAVTSTKAIARRECSMQVQKQH